MINQNGHKYEYSQSLKVLNKITPVKISEICDLIEEISKLSQYNGSYDEKHITELKSNVSDIKNIMEQSIILLNDVNTERQLLIQLVGSITEFLCNIMQELRLLQMKLDCMNISNRHKSTMSYQLHFLYNLIKEILI